jgi:hypothetical protein
MKSYRYQHPLFQSVHLPWSRNLRSLSKHVTDFFGCYRADEDALGIIEMSDAGIFKSQTLGPDLTHSPLNTNFLAARRPATT